jgi:hypothetical protein
LVRTPLPIRQAVFQVGGALQIDLSGVSDAVADVGSLVMEVLRAAQFVVYVKAVLRGAC